jgi:phytoene dehydrogenase-like protein
MAGRYSAIVVGAGHNGLVAANYLARAGASVLVLERRDFVGGACITEELFPGFRVSSCSYVCHLLQGKVIEDLELRKHGLEIYPLDPYRFHPLPNNQSIVSWHDDERTIESIGRVFPRDARRFRDWIAFWERAAGILHRYFLSEPPTLAEVAASVRGTGDEAIFERMLTGSTKDLVEEYFESPLVRAAFIEAHDAGDVRAPGSIMAVAYIRCNLFTDHKNLGIPKGGMGGITQAMARAAQAHGVEIRTGVEVERIVVRHGRATGVVLDNGERIEADVVLSNADPKRTFLTLVDRNALEPAFFEGIQRLKTNISCLKFHCALRELPDFSAYLGKSFDPKVLAQIRICPSVDYFEQSWDDAKRGRPSSCPVMYVQLPSVYDEGLTPPGQHVMSVWSLYAPMRLREGTWDAAKQQVGEHLIDTLAQYAPNIRDAMIDWELFTPADLERRVYLTDGNIRHLDIIPQQMLAGRPNRQLSGYRTPIEGLYLCGAGTHPGGEVTGAPGHNAAHAVLRDWEQSA